VAQPIVRPEHSRTDLVGALMGRGRGAIDVKASARDVMSAATTSVTADTTVSVAVDEMLQARRKVLPITDADGRLLSTADGEDLLHHLADSAESHPTD